MASVIERLTELEQDMKSIIAENARLRQCVVQLSEIVGETDENPNVEPGPRVKIKPSKADLVRYDEQTNDEDEEDFDCLICCDSSDATLSSPAKTRKYFAGFGVNGARWAKIPAVAKLFLSEDDAEEFLLENKKRMKTPNGYGPAFVEY